MKNIKANQPLHSICSALLGLLLAACSLETETNVVSGAKSQTLHIGNGTEPQGLDPHTVTGVTENRIISTLLEGLIREQPDTLEPLPGVAESWTISADARNYTFSLRKNARWSNGDPVTAHDFVYSWRRMLSPGLAAEYAYQLFLIKNAAAYNRGELTDFDQVGVKAIDPHTLHVELNYPTPYFLSLLVHYSTFPVHPPTIEKFGDIDERSTLWTRHNNFVGNGPFALKEWALNRIIKVEKNPYYWDAQAVRLNAIYFYPIEDVTTEERMFRSGTLHVTSDVPKEKIQVYRKKNPELLHIYPYLGTYYYSFNVTRPPFDDYRVRRAFSMSVDRQKIVQAVAKGGELPAYALTPPNTSAYFPKAKIPFDIQAAKDLMAAAGYPGGQGFPAMEILYNTHEGHRKIAVAIQQMWKQALGVHVTLTNQEWKVYLSRRNELDFEIARASWIGDYTDPNTFLDMFVTGGGNNNTGWSNPDYDRLIRLAGQTTDQHERYAIFQQAEKILIDESPIIPIYTYTTKHLLSPQVKGWARNILDHYPYKRLYIEKTQE